MMLDLKLLCGPMDWENRQDVRSTIWAMPLVWKSELPLSHLPGKLSLSFSFSKSLSGGGDFNITKHGKGIEKNPNVP